MLKELAKLPLQNVATSGLCSLPLMSHPCPVVADDSNSCLRAGGVLACTTRCRSVVAIDWEFAIDRNTVVLVVVVGCLLMPAAIHALLVPCLASYSRKRVESIDCKRQSRCRTVEAQDVHRKSSLANTLNGDDMCYLYMKPLLPYLLPCPSSSPTAPCSTFH